MSISVQNAVKLYGHQKALNNVSFEIGAGEIVGFLGPNGAGKSTMMKIITGYLPQSGGEVHVCGINTRDQSEALRRNIGYLPEHNPLYLDMYVKEYLEMVGGLYRLPHKIKRVTEMVELTGLGYEQHKKIGALSKGYRQRVGLAQALIHDPAVLILDEPTTGLDPNQIAEVRQLIKNIGAEKTVMLSTHIMQEVEAICHRVLIINKGVLVADQKSNELGSLSTASKSVVEIEFDKNVDPFKLKSLGKTTEVEQINDATYRLSTSPDEDVRPALFHLAVSEGAVILSLSRQKQGLEDVFHALTR